MNLSTKQKQSLNVEDNLWLPGYKERGRDKLGDWD